MRQGERERKRMERVRTRTPSLFCGLQVAIIWEGDEPGQVRKITYKELHREVFSRRSARLHDTS